MADRGREIDREVLAILVADSPLSVMEIASAADRHPIAVDQTCARLHEDGEIRPAGRGIYDVTAEGRRRIGTGSDS